MSQVKLLITIPNEILLGCFDMISVYGGDPEGKQAEQVVSDVITSLILGMRDDRLIPTYESETESFQKLDEYFPELKTSVLSKLEDMALKLEDQIQEGDSFSSIKEEIDPSVIEDSKNLVEDEETAEEGLHIKAFSELPEKDILVIEAKGNSIKEESLALLYSRISSDLWGTQNARKMWELILSKKEIPAVSAEKVEQAD